MDFTSQLPANEEIGKALRKESRMYPEIAIRELVAKAIDEMTNEIKTKLPKMYSKDLVEILFKLPYTKRQNLIDENLGTSECFL